MAVADPHATMKATLQHLFSLFWVLFFAFQGHAGTVLNGIDAEPGSGVEVEVTTVFEHAPSEGTLPMRVRISNGTASDGVWRFRFSGRRGQGIATNAVFKVKAGENRTFPISPLLEEGSLLPPRVSISGPAMVAGEATIPLVQRRPGSYDNLPLEPLSRSLAGPSLERFRNRERTGGAGDRFGVTRFEASDLPEAWVGLTGLEWLWLTEAEWTALDPEVRNAIRRWVAFGGELVLASRDPAVCEWTATFPSPDGQVSAKGPHAYGSGRFRAIPWDGSQVGVEALNALVASGQRSSREPALAGWPLFQRLGEPGSHHLFVACFVVVFATLVGPVNLFWLAPAGRRHRLFVTTPLLSLGGTFILLLAMYVTDGTGGSGSRFTAIELFPETGEALVTQDQVARTGLLLSNRFTLREEALLHPIQTPGAVRLEKEIAGRSYSVGQKSRRLRLTAPASTTPPKRAAPTRSSALRVLRRR